MSEQESEEDFSVSLREEKRQEKRKKQRGVKKQLDISMVAIADNVVFSKTSKWAYYRIRNSAFEFLDDYSKVRYAREVMNAFNALFADKTEPLECHIVSTSTPVDIDQWEDQMEQVTENWNRSMRFQDYRAEQAHFLRGKEYMRRVTYLGVNLGKRGAFDFSNLSAFQMGFEGAKDTLKNAAAKVLQTPGTAVSKPEEIEAARQEKEVGRTLAMGALKAQPASTEEILLLMKRQLWPAMPAPYLSVDPENRVGSFDLELESISAIKKRYRWLEINQMVSHHELTGYRATLSISKLPKSIQFPSMPFMHTPGAIGLPFTTYSRFSLLPNKKMKTKLYRKRQEMDDQLENMREGGHSANLEMQEDINEAQALEYDLSNDNHPWVQGSYRIVIETPDLEQLKSVSSELIQYYQALDINVNWTAGDQVDLFLEQMPGDRLRIGSFNMLTNLAMLGISGMNISNEIGDPLWGDVDALQGGGR